MIKSWLQISFSPFVILISLNTSIADNHILRIPAISYLVRVSLSMTDATCAQANKCVHVPQLSCWVVIVFVIGDCFHPLLISSPCV